MKHALLRWNVVLAGLCVTAGLAGCVSAPQGPRVAIMPAPGKPLDLFAAEDQYCRGYARQSLGPDTRGEAAVGSAVLGTLLGAAIGSATSTRRYNNTAAGAATGLLMGTAIGAGNSADEGRSAQQRYDIAYEQCMVSRNNQSSRHYYRQPASVVVMPQAAPAPMAPAYPAGSYPPPPPGSPPPPPPGMPLPPPLPPLPPPLPPQ
ncbi:hypothetical protein [Candidatus Aalborgicola defluviihabitans]|uniref:hypothetical protein n=1 Tax=Candidatus Aalborgicola defluviihabitans TaxID=3386187 RepID=UPI001D4FBA20|nr:hypothetical protein [Burkholderiales bacterium]MBK7280120.1 hypothetical protein [Burkholderiales bacterium]MBK7315638.1 hypothetical protein [Burkholderiales bacterium]MBL0243072.1 hypothetical protein [Rhodoferax sp.]